METVSEINRLTWDDVNLKERYVILYTRKKRGGHLTPRKVAMTQKFFDILPQALRRDRTKPWVFWHTYWSSKSGKMMEGLYQKRKRIMRTLCKKAGINYFRFHVFGHSGASVMDENNVPLGAIQRIPGHENRRTTEIYSHSMGESERRLLMYMNKPGRILTRILT